MNMTDFSIVYALLVVVAGGFFWRWIDRIDKKIDRLFDLLQDMASKAELKELKTELKQDISELWQHTNKLEEKYNSCPNCKSK